MSPLRLILICCRFSHDSMSTNYFRHRFHLQILSDIQDEYNNEHEFDLSLDMETDVMNCDLDGDAIVELIDVDVTEIPDDPMLLHQSCLEPTLYINDDPISSTTEEPILFTMEESTSTSITMEKSTSLTTEQNKQLNDHRSVLTKNGELNLKKEERNLIYV